MKETIEIFSKFINAYPLEGWFIIYALLLFATTLLGQMVGSWRVGFVIGIAGINGFSIAFATIAMQSQPLWVTMIIFLLSTPIGYIVLTHRVPLLDRKFGG